MPIFKNRMAFEFPRNIRLFLHIEAGLTGLESIPSRIRSRLGIKSSTQLPPGKSRTPMAPPQTENSASAQQRKPVGQCQRLDQVSRQAASTRCVTDSQAEKTQPLSVPPQDVRNTPTEQKSTPIQSDIPIPPLEMRQLVGPTEPEAFDNPTGKLVFPFVPESAYEAVFDFGCGCGRLARQMLQQKPRPKRYVGVDIHRGMVDWCQNNLGPVDENFRFQHHDVYNPSHAPDNTRRLIAPFKVEDSVFSLVIAWSVFTHIYERQALYYLKEISRILRPDGQLVSTWFLFDKREFPMMQDFQNTLFINEKDPTNAVIFDREWVRKAVTESGLAITDIDPPNIRGFQWRVTMTPQKPGVESIDFPPDEAPYGSMPPPLMPQISPVHGEESALEARES